MKNNENIKTSVNNTVNQPNPSKSSHMIIIKIRTLSEVTASVTITVEGTNPLVGFGLDIPLVSHTQHWRLTKKIKCHALSKNPIPL